MPYPPCDWPGCSEEGKTINQGLHPVLEERLRAQGGFEEFIRKTAFESAWLCYIHGPTPVKAEVSEGAIRLIGENLK